jgi:peptide/nickel transport system substrate-binding protein
LDIVIFNTTHKPFDDPRVRQALSLAVNRWGGNEIPGKVTSVLAHLGYRDG